MYKFCIDLIRGVMNMENSKALAPQGIQPNGGGGFKL